ncbi:hypothetical protein GGI19_001706 [Coemansia pectinata]|uniref:Uncharacterized protein n=1 Tax=Coemansia pectinata TaxID=1052879 RepID=A0A9W8H0Y6_9FUNG|nr:hypothetical protein GGI19_001706 [Coemansia pectinata]
MEADDSDDDDGHANAPTAHLRRGMDSGDENNGYYDSDYCDSYESESESDDDEHLINMFGPSCGGSSVGIKLHTNIGLLRSAGQIGNAREIQIIVLGKSQTAGQLKRQLRLAGLGGETAWPGIERLRIDMRNGSDVTQTNYLSQALPSLREIEYYDYNSKKLYHGVPIERLIKERLYGSTPLRVLRVKADCRPRITDYERGDPACLSDIACMEIECPEKTCVMPFPVVMANTLVNLKLDPVIQKYMWRSHIPKADSASPTPDISLPSLQSLSLGFLATIEGSSQNSYQSGSSSSEDSGDDSQYYDNVHYSIRLHYLNSRTCNSPKFPVLTTLELRICQTNIKDALQMFAASPVSSLQLRCSLANVNGDWDLADIYRLRSFSIRIVDAIQDYCDTDIGKPLSAVFSTASPSLRYLTLSMNLSINSRLLFNASPSFADNLDCLTLD